MDVDNALSDLKGSLLTPGQTQPITKSKKEKKQPGKRGRKKKDEVTNNDMDTYQSEENNDVLEFNDLKQKNTQEENYDEDDGILDADEYLLEEALKLQLGDKNGDSDDDDEDGDSES